MRIANGYGAVKDITFRIATMGETICRMWKALLSLFEEYLKQ